MKNNKLYQFILGPSPLLRLRLLVQWGMLLWCAVLGVQLGLFVGHFESGGSTAYYPRSPGVEAFLPIGALVSLKNWLVNGQIDSIHPAALVLFLTFVAMAILSRKSFCSWLCPVGTIEELMWKIGQKVFGRLWHPWNWLDRLLQSLKYVLLALFVKLILIDMPAAAVKGFLAAPYWAVSDVKMLHFFTGLSGIPLGTIIVLLVLSLFLRNPWCRYLCPYGALLGVFSALSPARIRRDTNLCVDCGACTQVCPSRLPVAIRGQVISPECTGCLTCVENCPQPGALGMSFLKKTLPRWVFPSLVLAIFSCGVAGGMLSGHWQTALTYADYQRLIPLIPYLDH